MNDAVHNFLFFVAGMVTAWWLAWAYVECVNAKMENNYKRIEFLTAKLAECQRIVKEKERQ